MDNTFQINEKLYRAVYPPEIMEMYWKKDGNISSAAFADPKGLSVDRGNFREDTAVVSEMRKKLAGHIVFLYVRHCFDIGAIVKYLPSKNNPYHSEIHGNEENPLLSKSQRRFLADRAVLIT